MIAPNEQTPDPKCAGCGETFPPSELHIITVAGEQVRQCARCVARARWQIAQQVVREERAEGDIKTVDQFVRAVIGKANSSGTPRTHARDLLEVSIQKIGGHEAFGELLSGAILRLAVDDSKTVSLGNILLGLLKQVKEVNALDQQADQSDLALLSKEDIQKQLAEMLAYARSCEAKRITNES